MKDIEKHANLARKIGNKIAIHMGELHKELFEGKEVDPREAAIVVINAGAEAMTRFIHIVLEMDTKGKIDIDAINFDVHKLLSELLAKYSGRMSFCAELSKKDKEKR